jgi:hypothetical protein
MISRLDPIRRAALFMPLVLSVAAAQAPSSEEQAAFIAASREHGLAYSKTLPNFLCTEVTRRSSTPASQGLDGPWKLADTLTIRLSYFDQKEDYRVIKINGKPVNKPLSSVSGWATKGDFGSMLRAIFDEESHAKFVWERWDTWKGRRVAVYSYRIERDHSGFTTDTGSQKRTNWGAKGVVHIDADTRQAVRLTVESMEMPAASAVKDVNIAIDYDFLKIGTDQFLLPSHSVTIMIDKNGKTARKSDSEFSEYRKFSADTKLQFDGK